MLNQIGDITIGDWVQIMEGICFGVKREMMTILPAAPAVTYY